ncbi:hypothetical protein AVEN_254001-1 [Araneus ventricosus]|uniref:Uncharacterized protein n=1 Tax=Araneus ventricosus TaxID=182803 RepID=A0A4Y2E5R8_ARAVE|nr:hypothetical protein AVEN_254001-1 [Araneus ventricosus]
MGQTLKRKNIHRTPPKISLIPVSWNRQDMIFTTGQGKFPSYFKCFHIKESDCYVAVRNLRRWQEEWDNGLTGRNIHRILPKVSLPLLPGTDKIFIFAPGQGPFSSYFRSLDIKESAWCGCGEVGEPLHYSTSSPFTASYHLTKPTQDLETV